MTERIQSVDELDPADVTAERLRFSTLIEEMYPELDTRQVVLHDLVAQLSGGVVGAVLSTETARYLAARSLLAVAADPAAADTGLVDHIVSNLLVTRRKGSRASGELVVVVSGAGAAVVPAGTVYLAGELRFQVDSAVIARRPVNDSLRTGERLLSARGDGTYEFTVPVTAVAVGPAGNLAKGTSLVPGATQARFVKAYAAADLTGGALDETNDDLLARIDQGLPAPVMQGRDNIAALIRSRAAFADAPAFGIVGIGSPEMLRDKHGLWPVATGGRVDIHARTAELPVTTGIRKTCVLVALDGAAGTWQFSMTRTDVPGFYEIVRVALAADPLDFSGYEITADSRGMDVGDAPHDVISAEEAGYTAYQTAVVRFLDPATTGYAVGDTRDYDVDVLAMPGIGDLQALIDEDGSVNLMADVLARAVVPCFLTAEVRISLPADADAPDDALLRAAIAAAVNALPLGASLHVSRISDAARPLLGSRLAVEAVLLRGRVRRPDGEEVLLRAADVLTIPAQPIHMVTPDTTAWLLRAEDVLLTYS